MNYSTDGIGICVINWEQGVLMEILWETRKTVITPEEVVERINKCFEQWAAEEKAEADQKATAEQKDKEGYE